MYETHNPVEDRFDYYAKGTFRCSHPTERVSIIIVAAVFVFITIAWYAVLFEQLRWYFEINAEIIGVNTAKTIGYVYVFSELFMLAVTAVIIHLILGGIVWNYSADGTHFSLWSEKARTRKTDIYYDDVVSVRYDEYYLFGTWLRGYVVCITTRSAGTIRLEYLFNKSITNKTTQNTPFYIIEERVAMITENAAVYGR